MKTKILKLCLIILSFSLLGTGCEKDENFFELQIGDENPVIKKEVNGIEFKFCLLNEKGEPATVFNEGENFTFQFSIINNRQDSLPFWDLNFYRLDDFCAVNSSKKYYGKPFIFIGSSYTPVSKWLPSKKEHYQFKVPWYDERDEWVYFWAEFMSTKQPLLNRGKYYTQFAYAFTFETPVREPEVITDTITFKINFEIK